MNSRKRGSRLDAAESKKPARKKYSTEAKLRIVLEGLRGKKSVSEICRAEGINPNLYYNWSKKFITAGKNSLNGKIDTNVTPGDLMNLKIENMDLKELVAELSLEIRNLKNRLNSP